MRLGKALPSQDKAVRDAGQPTRRAENPGAGPLCASGLGCTQDSKEEAAGGGGGCGLARAAGEGRRGVSLVQRFRVYSPSSPCFCPRVPCCVLTPGHPLLVPQLPHPPGISAWGALALCRPFLPAPSQPWFLTKGLEFSAAQTFFVLLAGGTHPSPASGKLGRSGRQSTGERPFAEFCLWSSPLFLPSREVGTLIG